MPAHLNRNVQSYRLLLNPPLPVILTLCRASQVSYGHQQALRRLVFVPSRMESDALHLGISRIFGLSERLIPVMEQDYMATLVLVLWPTAIPLESSSATYRSHCVISGQVPEYLEVPTSV
jgi:hypothetical protein